MKVIALHEKKSRQHCIESRSKEVEMRWILLLMVSWLLVMPTEVLGQEKTGWADTLFWDHPLDSATVDTTKAIYVGHTDPRTLTVWTKADINTPGDTVDVTISYQFKLSNMGTTVTYDWDVLGNVVKDHLRYPGWTFWRFIEPTKAKAVVVPVDSLPGLGQDFVINLGNNARNQELINLSFRLTTSATDIDRYVSVIIEDPVGSLFTALQFTQPQDRNQVRQYVFFPGIPEIGPTNTLRLCQAPMPPNLVLKRGARIRSQVANLQPDDNITNISLGLRKGIQSEFDFQMPGSADSLRFIVSGKVEDNGDIDIYLTVSGGYW
jgi:hypothetical protein